MRALDTVTQLQLRSVCKIHLAAYFVNTPFEHFLPGFCVARARKLDSLTTRAPRTAA
jgi:hypothetical protein